MKRRIILIAIIVIVVIAVAALFWFFSRGQSGGTPSTGSTGSLPSVGTQSGTGNGSSAGGNGSGSVGTFSTGNTGSGAPTFGVISNEPVIAYSVDSSNNVVIMEPDGRVASITNGQPTFLSSTAIQNIISAGFSYDGSAVAVNFGDPQYPQAGIFTVATKSWLSLPTDTLSFAWSPIDDRIAYLQLNKDGSETLATLNIADATSTPVTLAGALHLQGVSLAWPSANRIVIADKPSAYENGSLLFFGVSSHTFSSPLSAGAPGLDTAWSDTTSSQALVLEANAAQRGGTLSLWNTADGSMQGLSFVTLPSKCVFHDEVATSTAAAAATPQSTSTSVGTSTEPVPLPFYLAFYCAVPQDQNSLAGQPLPDAYNQRALFTVDSFFKVRTDTGEMQNVFSPPISVDATNLRIFNNVLFFVNRYDQKLYALSLGS